MQVKKQSIAGLFLAAAIGVTGISAPVSSFAAEDPAPAAVTMQAQSGDVATYRRAVEQRFAQWLDDLWPDAQKAGVSRKTFDENVKSLTLDWSSPHLVLPNPAAPGGPALPHSLQKSKKPQHQPEFDVPEYYFKTSGLNGMGSVGRSKLAQWRNTLATIENQYGVPPGIVLAVWGRETAFGRAAIPYDTVQALATQSFMGERPTYFRGQLVTALKILDEGHISRAGMKSSWAGAMGHTQFMPSDFMNFAVDFNGDGKKDIWGTIQDALASTANSLKTQGWDGSVKWGYEVRVPSGFDCTLQGPHQSNIIGEWVKRGLVRTDGKRFSTAELGKNAFLVMPAGMKGPVFLATDNFSVIKRYNNSDVYAIYVGHVSDMITEGASASFDAGWEKVDRFSRDDIRKLQEDLVARGYNVGGVDGLVGNRTRIAIGKKEKDMGLTPVCYPNKDVMKGIKGP